MTVKNKTWKNKTNTDWYNIFAPEEMVLLAKKGGLDGADELDMVSSYLDHSKAILEVGAGYGRVIDGLLARSVKADIVGVERSSKYFEYLTKKYNNNNVYIINDDIMNYYTQIKFDVILALFAEISEFSKDEQLLLIKHLKSFLSKEGVLVIDIIDRSLIPHYVDSQNAGEIRLKWKYAEINTYTPTEDEMTTMFKDAGLTIVNHTPYRTKKHRDRNLYIVKHA